MKDENKIDNQKEKIKEEKIVKDEKIVDVYIAKVDINRKYRMGYEVPTEEVLDWKKRTIDIDKLVTLKSKDLNSGINPFLDDYLNRNAAVVVASLEKDNFTDEIKKQLLDMELENKNREEVIKFLV